ncbi:hypothetical protein BDD12DRAFT_806599 [Trichophaea hybrida]|nr:hypothetical protein BDD12DRAFT_806599 [Trichophaea hybrida]
MSQWNSRTWMGKEVITLMSTGETLREIVIVIRDDKLIVEIKTRYFGKALQDFTSGAASSVPSSDNEISMKKPETVAPIQRIKFRFGGILEGSGDDHESCMEPSRTTKPLPNLRVLAAIPPSYKRMGRDPFLIFTFIPDYAPVAFVEMPAPVSRVGACIREDHGVYIRGNRNQLDM